MSDVYCDNRVLRDVLAEGFVGAPDYVIASGTFNIRIEDHDRWLREIDIKMS